MRLLIINDYGIWGGGTENRIRLLVDELLKKNVFEQIHILSANETMQPTAGVVTHKIDKKKLTFICTMKIILKHKINIIQVHNLSTISPTAILSAKILRKPIIFFAHDYWPICGRRSFIKAETASKESLCEQTNLQKCINCIGLKSTVKLLLWKKIVNLCNVGVSAGNFLKNLYEKEGVLQNKWKIVPPWIDLTKFKSEKNTPKKENIILFVSSLMEFKGAWVVAKAFKHVLKKIPSSKLIFIGDGQEPESKYRQDINQILKRDKTADKTIFLGRQNWDEIHEWHLKSKVFVFPTICMESFGLAWAEAMASGVPVIASAIGSVPEFVNNKGLQIQPRNEIDWANAIIKIMRNKKLADKMSKEGKKYAFNLFDVQKASIQIKTIYDSLIK